MFTVTRHGPPSVVIKRKKWEKDFYAHLYNSKQLSKNRGELMYLQVFIALVVKSRYKPNASFNNYLQSQEMDKKFFDYGSTKDLYRD